LIAAPVNKRGAGGILATLDSAAQQRIRFVDLIDRVSMRAANETGDAAMGYTTRFDALVAGAVFIFLTAIVFGAF
jgi:hypothetical protein